MDMDLAITIITAYKERLMNSASNQLDADIEAFDNALLAMKNYRPNGSWISDVEKPWVLRCSICNEKAHLDDYEGEYIRSNYCPHCGAKMVAT